jgi:hypothetical protein
MPKRGPKPKGKVKIEWSSEFAYAIGLITTDGSLSKDGRHISFVSNDIEQIENFKKCLRIKNRTSKHDSGSSRIQKGARVQFGDVLFYNFLLKIGITPNKSKTLSKVLIPDKYFFDFLRGHFDGDGCFYSYWDPRWKSSFMFYTELVSASKEHIDWLQQEITRLISIKGRITKSKNNPCYRLKFAKAGSLVLLKKMYYKNYSVGLKRKHLKIQRALGILDLSL